MFNNPLKPYISNSLNKEYLLKKDTTELKKIGDKLGIKLDGRKRKETLVEELYAIL